jgi:hypothetical protein
MQQITGIIDRQRNIRPQEPVYLAMTAVSYVLEITETFNEVSWVSGVPRIFSDRGGGGEGVKPGIFFGWFPEGRENGDLRAVAP